MTEYRFSVCGRELAESERPPRLPLGISVFEPQGSDWLVLRTPDGTYRMEAERARDLARLLFARTECYIDADSDRQETEL